MAQEPQLDLQTTWPGVDAEGDVAVASDDRAPEHQYCIFRAGKKRYSLSVLEVEEIVDWPSITRVPLAPPFLMGIFNLRGVIVPVLDIARPAERGRQPDAPPKKLVVAAVPGSGDRDDLRVGLVSDEVVGTYVTPEPLLVEEAPRDVPHCCGLLRHDDHLALALDLRRLAEAFPISVI